jgi:hypothetical protein
LRRRRLAGLEGWLADRFHQHRGNCDVVRQDLMREHGLLVSLRTLERAAAPRRRRDPPGGALEPAAVS